MVSFNYAVYTIEAYSGNILTGYKRISVFAVYYGDYSLITVKLV